MVAVAARSEGVGAAASANADAAVVAAGRSFHASTHSGFVAGPVEYYAADRRKSVV